MAEAAPLYPSGRIDEADHEGRYLGNEDPGLHGTDDTESSMTSDGEDEDEEEDEDEDDIGLQTALAASRSEVEDALRQEELDLQRAIDASKDADQDVKFTWDTQRAIEISLHEERTLEEMRKFRDELLDTESTSSDQPGSPSSVMTVSPDGTTSRARHHPFLSPPASVIFSADKTGPGPSGFSSLGAWGAVPIDSDSGTTATEVDISAYPLPPDSPSTGSMDLQEDEAAYGFWHGQRPGTSTTPPRSSSPPPTVLTSRVRPDVFHSEDSMLFPEVPARMSPQYERGVLPRGMQTIPITVVGGTEPVIIPVQVEDSRGLASHPQRKVPTLRSRSPSPTSEDWDVPFPEVVQSRERPTPPRDKRSHERAFSTRSAHMTYVSSSTSSSVQGIQPDDDTDRSLFTRLAVPPAVVPPKPPSVKLPSRYFVPRDLLADVEPRMSLQLFRTKTRPLFSDQCLCISCGAVFIHNWQQKSQNTRLHPGSLTCRCESCGVEFCHGCRRQQIQCEKPDSCRPRIATAIFRIMSLVDIELLRLGGPDRVSELLATKRQLVANALSAIVAYLNNSTHTQLSYLPHLINLSLLPVIFEYLLERPPKLWIETRATEDLYNQMLAFLVISLDVGRGEILLQQRGRIVWHRGVYEMMQETGGITWDGAVPARSLADIIECICMGDFMKEAEDYISRRRYLFDHLSDHVDRIRHLFEGVERLRMMDDSGKAVPSRRSNYEVVL
ncbi:hypothetical protein F5146DRAFT_1069982 [Armillaria mellea]|nr:hypothetical protein F5146DRAFT_1069982 [Armillaria mellea]